MKTKLILSILLLVSSLTGFAGDYLTNTNQNVAFLRMVARGASIDIDGVYSNPAGLAFMHDGFYLSLNGQSAYQTRTIQSTFPLYKYVDGNDTRTFKGTASAPFIPSFQAMYKKGDWTISGSFAVTGGGGKASFSDGLPSFTSKVMAGIYANKDLAAIVGGPVTPDKYTISSAMDGKQYIFGAQLGVTYKINDWLAAFAGGRMNYVNSGYEGFITANLKGNDMELVNMELDCDQTGWGITPIIGLDAKLGKLNLAAKYEFKTNLNVENKTHKNSTNIPSFNEGVITPHDIPAMLMVAAGYEILPTLRATVEYHFFDDKAAGMAGDKQKSLTKGTQEFLAGVEWDVLDRLTLSAGVQNTNYGLSDDFQSDISFSCDSYSVGLGAAVKLTNRMKLNVAYFWTNYSDYTKEVAADQTPGGGYNGTTLAGKDVFSRTNKVFGLGIDYRF